MHNRQRSESAFRAVSAIIRILLLVVLLVVLLTGLMAAPAWAEARSGEAAATQGAESSGETT